MTTSKFNLHFSAGDECYAVLTGLDRSVSATQFEMDRMDAFGSHFGQLRRGAVNGSVTFDRTVMFEGFCDSCIIDILDTLIYCLDEVIEEYVVNDEVVHPRTMVDEAATALKRLRKGAKSVTMCEEAAWEIELCTMEFGDFWSMRLKTAQAVLDRAKAQLPPNACWLGIEGHNHTA
jgi:hypothetical protein